MHVSNRDASKRFYDCVLAPLGHRLTHPGDHYDEWDDFGITQADERRAVTRGLHVAFVAGSTAEVDVFWRAGTDARYASDGEPGPRPVYHEAYYGAFLLDPDGNNIEAVCHNRP